MVGLGSGCVRQSGRRALHCEYDTDYSFSSMTLRLYIKVMDDERRSRIEYGSRGQRPRSTIALYV